MPQSRMQSVTCGASQRLCRIAESLTTLGHGSEDKALRELALGIAWPEFRVLGS